MTNVRLCVPLRLDAGPKKPPHGGTSGMNSEAPVVIADPDTAAGAGDL